MTALLRRPVAVNGKAFGIESFATRPEIDARGAEAYVVGAAAGLDQFAKPFGGWVGIVVERADELGRRVCNGLIDRRPEPDIFGVADHSDARRRGKRLGQSVAAVVDDVDIKRFESLLLEAVEAAHQFIAGSERGDNDRGSWRKQIGS